MTHKELDNYLLEEKSFKHYLNSKNSTKIKATDFLYQDPYYRFKRLLLLIEKSDIKFDKFKWIDLGCGPAAFISILLNKCKVHNITGVDQWNLKEQIDWLDFKYHCINIENDFTKITDNNYDVVSALEVIEHMIDTDNFLLRCKAIINTNGYLVLTTPNINSLRNRLLVPFGYYPAPMEYKDIIRHVRLYNVGKLKSHLKEYNFKLINIIGVNFLPTKLLKYSVFRHISEKLADHFPQFCPNVCIIAQKIEE